VREIAEYDPKTRVGIEYKTNEPRMYQLVSNAAKASPRASSSPKGESRKARVSLVRTSDRAAGVTQSVDLLGINPVKGKKVLLKPNFNTADAYPGSTHNDTLISLIRKLKAHINAF
jgi:hypothetical protein